ncbi:MAG: YbaN family protein [Blastocatellia bacterium]|nr:YbaN family protein [Blastocatellia bacterium]
MDLIVRIVLNVLGTVFVLIGILGIILPLLPATPFFLLASACYVRGSKRLYGWLMNNNHIGPYIKNFKEHRAMPLRAKIVTIAILWVSLIISIYRIEIVILQPVLIIVGIGVTILILRIRTLKLSQ